LSVAEALQPDLAQGFQIDALRLRVEMERAFGGSDATGDWDWKLAYEAGELALVLFLRKFGRALLARAGSPVGLLPILAKVAGLLPTHTRRSEEMERFQQFSTPLPMGLAALAAAQIAPCDLVLEPSAGTGLLAILAEIAGGSLALNELADTRADLLSLLFPGRPFSRFDAAQIDDHLDAGVGPSVILMNPPFSAVAVPGDATPKTACPPLLPPSRVPTPTSPCRPSATGWKPCANAHRAGGQTGNHHQSGCCWSAPGSWGCLIDCPGRDMPSHGRIPATTPRRFWISRDRSVAERPVARASAFQSAPALCQAMADTPDLESSCTNLTPSAIVTEKGDLTPISVNTPRTREGR
jgi:hypothetical protein